MKRKKRLEEARLEKEKKDEEEKLKLEAEKREKDQYKKQLKKERKTLRTYVKNKNYFAKNEEEKVSLMDDIERLVDLLTLSEIQSLNETLESANKENVARDSLLKMLNCMNNRIDDEKNQETKFNLENEIRIASEAAEAAAAKAAAAAEWADDEVKLLVKACKVIATGTRNRWEVIANFIEEHSRGKYKRTDKEVLNKTKDLQKIDPTTKEEFNKRAFEKTLQTITTEELVKDKPSERYNTPGEQLLAENGSNPAPWSVQEQKTLEQALKTYPGTLADRWEKIADCLPSRSKKDCIVRYKELVEVIQAKKKATAKAKP